MVKPKLPRTRAVSFGRTNQVHTAYAVIYYKGNRPVRRGVFSEERPTVLRGERTQCVGKMTSRRGFGEAQAALARRLGWPLR
jgi:hypothetical protein